MRLYVNIDHVATIREARKTDEPDPVEAAADAELAGADGITVHLREDRRHIQDADVTALADSVHTVLNLELGAHAAFGVPPGAVDDVGAGVGVPVPVALGVAVGAVTLRVGAAVLGSPSGLVGDGATNSLGPQLMRATRVSAKSAT